LDISISRDHGKATEQKQPLLIVEWFSHDLTKLQTWI